MKTRWIGITSVALILAALILGTLARYLLPNSLGSAANSGSIGPAIMGSSTISGGMMGNSGMMGGSNNTMNGSGMMGSSGGMMSGRGE